MQSRRDKQTDKGQSHQTSRLASVVFVAVIVVASFVMGRYTGSHDDARAQPADRPIEPGADRVAHTHRRERSLPGPRLALDTVTPPPESREDSKALIAYRETQAHELVDMLRIRVGATVRTMPGESPEAMANRLDDYMGGWLESLTRTAPHLIDAVADEMAGRMCDPQAGDAELIVWSRLARHTPALASSAGLDCVLSRRAGEDVVLWSALDAWRDSGLPATDAVTDLRRQARDPRTLRRFQTRDAESAEPAQATPPPAGPPPVSDPHP